MKIYDYNQEFGGNYYAPMIDYLNTKERQGIFFERPADRIHLPDPAEVTSDKLKKSLDTAGGPNIKSFLTKAYAQQIKEKNVSTAHTQAVLLRNSRDQTRLMPRLTAAMLRDHYVKELAIITASQKANSSSSSSFDDLLL